MKKLAIKFPSAALVVLALLCVRSEAAPTADDARIVIRATDYTQAEAEKWEGISRNSANENEKLTAQVLLAELWLKSGTPLRPKETRVKLNAFIHDAPETWQAQIARLQIMRTFDVNTETDDMIAEADEALRETRFNLLNNPKDPFLISYLDTLYSGIKDLREFFIYMRGACHATALDAEKAKADFGLLPAGELKTQLGYQIRDIEAMTPEQRTRHRQVLALAVKSEERQEAERGTTTPPEVFKAYMPTGQFSDEAVAKLETIKAASGDPIEKAVAELVILSHYNSPGSNMPAEKLRARLEALAAVHPGTWISVQCKIGMLETYSPSDQYTQRITILQSTLADAGLSALENPTDPYVRAFSTDGEGLEIAKAPRDFILFILAYNYLAGIDIESARRTLNEIQSPYWKERTQKHIARLEATAPDILAKRRDHFLKNQKPDI